MSWEPAVPLPFYNGLLWWLTHGRLMCGDCHRRFWRMDSYEIHWLTHHHPLGRNYIIGRGSD